MADAGQGRFETGMDSMPETWPDWPVFWDNPGEHARELARYVDTTQTWRLVPVNCFSPWYGPQAGSERAELLYEELRSRRIPYSHEPWNPVPFGPEEQARYGGAGTLQRVRGPNETIQGPATCLDLALVFAGMAMCADMRPFIALQSAPVLHALVVLPIQRARSVQGDKVPDPPGFTERPGEPGVWDPAPDGSSFAGDGNWLVIDVSLAARNPPLSGMPLPEIGAPFSAAKREELDLPGMEGASRNSTLVDVDRVRRTPLEPYVPPVGSAVPAIYGYLPTFPSFIDYPTRQELLADLHDVVGAALPPATIVLHGEPGRGKSMLAARLAVAADHGCGWFLNATDDKILTRSLAQAENQELGKRAGLAGPAMHGEGVDAIEDRGLASAALRRLSETGQPWVVVLDNCDSPPGLAGLRGLIPRPRTNGQVVIITTKDPDWARLGESSGWKVRELPPLGQPDLEKLGLASQTGSAVYGTPLIAQAVVALRERAAVTLPAQPGTDGPGLVWHLLRMSQHRWPAIGELARLLAWCPPEPVDADLLGEIGERGDGEAVGRRLAELSFVSPSFNAGRLTVQMHRLFAAAVRRQTWHDNPEMAIGVISRLLSAEQGRATFIAAADSKALGRLEHGDEAGEPGDVPRAAASADPSTAGLLWYNLGHIRERRGPVAGSDPHFDKALQLLDPEQYPCEVAESMIGRARVVYQNAQSSADQLTQARAQVAAARDLLAPLADSSARELREQGNALSWLIARRIAGRERNPRKRAGELAEVIEQLWLSYEARLRLIRGADAAIERGAPPAPSDDLSAERAYYNLSGTYLELAKVHHELAEVEPPGSERRRELLTLASDDLVNSRTVYQHVRRLREIRYRGQPHPHLAACVQGEAYVTYYRAILLGEHGALIDSFELTAEAMRQRQIVAGGPDSPAVLTNGDVQKSGQFMLKVAIAMLFAGSSRPSSGVENVMDVTREALAETFSRVSWPGPIEL